MTEWIAVPKRAAERRVAAVDGCIAAAVLLLVLAGMGFLVAQAATWPWAHVGTLGP